MFVYKNSNYLLKLQKILLITFVLVSASIYSQELDATVDVTLTNLPPDIQDKLSGFKQDVQNYLNKNRFTDQVIVNDIKGQPYKIKCNFNFIITAATGFDSYTGQVVVTVQRNIYRTQSYTPLLRIKDENWEFNYVKGQSFYRDDYRFNNLTSFLDYYAFFIIGIDDDSWEPELGTARFQKAQNIVNLAVSNNSRGWFESSSLKQSRAIFISELLNSKYNDFRKAFWLYHFAGIDSLQYNKRQALERLAEAVDMIGKVKRSEVRSFIIKAFFDVKHLEIAQVFTDYYDKTVYRRLMDIDPDHASIYEEWSKK
jgi:hypothetical protein